jgi:hypothetical protein
MSKLLRGVAAGYGAKKLGGGCVSTIRVERGRSAARIECE